MSDPSGTAPALRRPTGGLGRGGTPRCTSGETAIASQEEHITCPRPPRRTRSNLAYEAVDREYSGESAHTRRQLVGAAALGLGGLAAASVPGVALAASKRGGGTNDPQTILNIAATAEVLATIVNTVGPEKVKLDKVTKRNVKARRTRS